MSPMTRLPLTIEHALLGFLRERPMHGYEIHQRLRDPSGPGLVWRLKQSQLYALLAKLEDEGYISGALKPQETGPTRRIYRLTRSGRERYGDWVTSPVPHGREVRQEFLAKFYFAQCEGPDVAAQLIERQRTTCRDWLRAQGARALGARAGRPYEWLVCEFRVGQIEAILDWLDTCAAALARQA
jgi:PadR family transcriptional regulator AphA